MIRRVSSGLLAAVLVFAAVSAFAQTASVPANINTVLHATEAGKILPPSVFFRGQTAPIQARNSGGVKFGDGMFMLVALVDNSGYSTSIQQKYQAYFITEVPLEINGHAVAPGAYGAGFVQGRFNVMDIGNNELFAVEATRDAKIARPTPLQVIADDIPGHYRFYEGRNYVVVSRARMASVNNR